MSSHRPSKLLPALFLALMVIPPILIVAAVPWLKQQPAALVFLLSGIAAILTIFASFVLAILHDRKMDEWQRNMARFGSQWGWVTGASLVALLLALPAFRDVMVSTVASWAQVSNPNQKLVLLAFTLGFGAVVVAQQVCTALLAIGWAFWKSRAVREAS